jgi:hypothetical protein
VRQFAHTLKAHTVGSDVFPQLGWNDCCSSCHEKKNYLVWEALRGEKKSQLPPTFWPCKNRPTPGPSIFLLGYSMHVPPLLSDPNSQLFFKIYDEIISSTNFGNIPNYYGIRRNKSSLTSGAAAWAGEERCNEVPVMKCQMEKTMAKKEGVICWLSLGCRLCTGIYP